MFRKASIYYSMGGFGGVCGRSKLIVMKRDEEAAKAIQLGLTLKSSKKLSQHFMNLIGRLCKTMRLSIREKIAELVQGSRDGHYRMAALLL